MEYEGKFYHRHSISEFDSDSVIKPERAKELRLENFYKELSLDIGKEYEINELEKAVTVETLREYGNECAYLFDEKMINKFGGAIKLLEENKECPKMFQSVLCNGSISGEVRMEFSEKITYYLIKEVKEIRDRFSNKEEFDLVLEDRGNGTMMTVGKERVEMSVILEGSTFTASSTEYKYFSEELIKLIKAVGE